MQTYILMTKLSANISQQVKERAQLGRAWIKQVREKCPEVKFLSHYALLGPYDFLDIYEAPDAQTAAKIALISQQNGAITSESWPAIPYKQFLDLTTKI